MRFLPRAGFWQHALAGKVSACRHSSVMVAPNSTAIALSTQVQLDVKWLTVRSSGPPSAAAERKR
jgi:hypothetical protein